MCRCRRSLSSAIPPWSHARDADDSHTGMHGTYGSTLRNQGAEQGFEHQRGIAVAVETPAGRSDILQPTYGRGAIQTHRQFGDRGAVLEIDQADGILGVVLQHGDITVDARHRVECAVKHVTREARGLTLELVFLAMAL